MLNTCFSREQARSGAKEGKRLAADESSNNLGVLGIPASTLDRNDEGQR